VPSFPGFHKGGLKAGKQRPTPVPGQFFSELLPEIDNLAELKVSLYGIWKLDRMEGEVRYLRRTDFSEDGRFMQGLSENPVKAEATLEEALERAVGRGTFLCLQVESDDELLVGRFYFLNSSRGRAVVEAAKKGEWKPSPNAIGGARLAEERPNIFRLYEENIGPLTPLIADTLRDAEQVYPSDWLEEAVKIAVQRNARNWRFVEAVLKRWKEEGRDEQDRRDAEKNRRRYDEGEFADFIEH
jgi:DNA replication protein